MNYVLKCVVIKTLKDFLSVGSLQVKTARSLYMCGFMLCNVLSLASSDVYFT